MTQIPDTRLTQTLRTLWECTDGHEPWEDWYERQCVGGTENGRAVAAVLFDRARLYWPDFHSPADMPALVVWGDLIDRFHPFITPDIITKAVDVVAAQGVSNPVPGHFTQAAERIMQEAK